MLSEDELRLVHALQLAPRASWADLARILDRTAATLAGQWERLHTAGLAWVAAYPGGLFRDFVFALVEVDCAPGARAGLVARLCADPRVVTVEESTLGHDLLLTAMTPDLLTHNTLVLDDLAALDGVVRARSHVMTAVHRDGSSWSLDALTAEQTRRLATVDRRRVDPSTAVPADSGRLLDALVRDGRAAAAELARDLGVDPSTARRKLGRLLRSGAISVRCEVAAAAVGFPVSCTWHARISAADLPRTTATLATLPELRLCASTTGPTNLVITVWVRDLGHVVALEQRLAERLPWMTLTDSGLNLRTAKRVGWLLGPDGRSTGQVVEPSALAHLRG